MSAHTPGCSCDLGHDHASDCPRGRLHAAAPRMLVLLKYLMVPMDEDRITEVRDEARAILRDVEGKRNG